MDMRKDTASYPGWNLAFKAPLKPPPAVSPGLLWRSWCAETWEVGKQCQGSLGGGERVV